MTSSSQVLMDAADAQLMDDPSKISIMENLPTRQLISIHRINSRPGDLEAFWRKNNDVWFSTRGYTAQAVSAQPMPLNDQAVNYTQSVNGG